MQSTLIAERGSDFDLDVRVVEYGPMADGDDDTHNPTDDNCGQTCDSACATSCFHV